MEKKTIHIVLDMSRSMISIAPCLYLFIGKLLKSLEEKQGNVYRYQLTWFSGVPKNEKETKIESLHFGDDEPCCQSYKELLRDMKTLEFPIQHISRESSLKDAVSQAIINTVGRPEDRMILIFSDIDLSRDMSFYEEGAFRRTACFLREGSKGDLRFSIVRGDGRKQNDFPCLKWPLESMTKEYSQDDMLALVSLLSW